MTLTTTRPLPLPWQNSALRLPRVALHTQKTFPVDYRDVRFGPNMGQIGPNLDKSGNFSISVSVHVGSGSKINCEN